MNIKNKILIFGLFLILSGCSMTSDEEKTKLLPLELKDCKFISLGFDHNYVKVVRCPNSQTTTEISDHQNSKKYITVVDK